ncbi:hypothetical protein BDV25DRAFT_163689 [Aspergillus avenaceus]|uniref:Uncharacterized protein n=1 Tax=Aspergillus avenaceus TaxID=36643 RepID=A0A5N6THQ5_ASPAV|nr:hypothetical protein BDV25DRAFT_163689 [Aspergillus avenaceus]
MAETSAMATALHIILFPLSYILSYAYGILQVLVFPFVALAQFAFHLTFLPYRIISKFEVSLTFVFIAVVTGVILGSLLFSTTSITVDLLNGSLRTPSTLSPQESEDEYGDDNIRETKKEPISNLIPHSEKKRPIYSDSGLLPYTILEEEESNQGSSENLYD